MAARRRRRVRLGVAATARLLAPWLLIILHLLLVDAAHPYSHHQLNNNNHHHHRHNQHQHHHHATTQLHRTSHELNDEPILQAAHQFVGGVPSMAHLCDQLPAGLAKTLRLCRLTSVSDSADEAVSLGAAKGLAECRAQFRSERWNCTHSGGDHHLLTSELTQSVGNRESGFVQAIAAAGIVHSIALACSSGNLSDCACDKTRIGLIRRQDENWKWGGCSNNIRHGMLYAKHLVELLDAVHLHASSRTRTVRRFGRSLLARGQHQNQNQNGNKQLYQDEVPATAAAALCQRSLVSQNLTQTAHQQLIRSLLASDSLERHAEIRLAMNMHNNKVGRMAVAKNMELRCRCHGLSGSCSLKTCWLTLPNFQVIGAYLKRKYEASVHLPSALNVNKLIPLMDRQELSTILSNSNSNNQQPQNPIATTEVTIVDQQPLDQMRLISGANLSAPINAPAHFSYYERHKQLSSSTTTTTTTSSPSIRSKAPKGEEPNELEIVPMTQQQFQALLKEMRLCNSSSSGNGQSYLTTRDLSNQQQPVTKHLLSKSGKTMTTNFQQQQQHPLALAHHQLQHSLKNANQQLSQMLHSNRDDLIHLHRSPDYCEADSRHGFAGIQARACSNNPLAPDHCDRLCCGRGYTTRVYQQSYKCDCKFQYCCQVQCSECQRENRILVCN